MTLTASDPSAGISADPNAQGFRDEGDRLRDIGEYAKAAEAYGRFLAAHPDDFGIWVQRGNCLKDSGSYPAAKMAYEKALALEPQDADVYLQLGHLFKLMGQKPMALQAYKKSMQIMPSVKTAGEIAGLGGGKWLDDNPFGDHARINLYFEIDDFLNYLKAHPTMSGIQRVQAGLAQSLGEDTETSSVHFVVCDRMSKKPKIKKVDTDDLLDLIDFVSGNSHDHDGIRDKIALIEKNSIAIKLTKGGIYCILGAFWGYGGAEIGKYDYIKASGLKLIAYIYDIIPITHPEFCDQNLSHEFIISFGDGIAFFDAVFTISKFTADEVERLLIKHKLPQIPIEPVPLAHVLTSPSVIETDESLEDFPKLAKLADRDYVLYVSTIEGRKNHALVLALWQQMLREGLNPPDLVFVGRHGWRVSGVFELLDATRYLGNRVHILHDLSDIELHLLYDRCKFTVFTSFVEGWGLPVGESLVAGRACIASNTSSVPEVGGDFVDYIDPFDARAAIETVKKMCFDEAYLAQRTENIRQNFVPRTWQDVGANFRQMLERYVTDEVTNPRIHHPALKELKRFSPSDLRTGSVTDKYIANPMRLAIGRDFYLPEDFGSWMKRTRGTLTVRTDLPEGEPVHCIVGLAVAPWLSPGGVRAHAGGPVGNTSQQDREWLKLTADRDLLVEGKVGKDGLLSCTIEVTDGGPYPQNGEVREFYVGLRWFMYVRSSDIIKRMALMERYLFGAAHFGSADR